MFLIFNVPPLIFIEPSQESLLSSENVPPVKSTVLLSEIFTVASDVTDALWIFIFAPLALVPMFSAPPLTSSKELSRLKFEPVMVVVPPACTNAPPGFLIALSHFKVPFSIPTNPSQLSESLKVALPPVTARMALSAIEVFTVFEIVLPFLIVRVPLFMFNVPESADNVSFIIDAV